MTADPLAEIDALLARVPENPWVIPEPHDWRNGSPPPPAALAGNLAGGLRAARAVIAEQAAQIQRMRGVLENILISDIPRPLGRRWRKDGESSDHDECPHGAMMYEDCPACLDAYIKGALGMEGAAEVYPGGV